MCALLWEQGQLAAAFRGEHEPPLRAVLSHHIGRSWYLWAQRLPWVPGMCESSRGCSCDVLVTRGPQEGPV